MPRPAIDKHGFIYFIESLSQNAIKVGFADDLTTRLATLQTGNPGELVVLGKVRSTFRAELALHKLLKPYCRSREWYEADSPVYEIATELLDTAMDKAICEMVADGEEGPDAYRHRYSDVTLTVDEVLEVASGVLAWCAEMDAAGAVSA